jgi:RNA polymerase sigma factor (TIGR02999 family)
VLIPAPAVPASAEGASRGDVTEALHRLSLDDGQAQAELLPLVYDELRRIALGLGRRERSGHTLQATALVHEAYLQLFGRKGLQLSGIEWRDRRHFLACAARLMRHILVDHARRRNALKRGGDVVRVALDDDLDGAEGLSPLVVAVDDALRTLEELDPRATRVVELRFFAGLTLEEAADTLGVSRKTVVREWRKARAWLAAELEPGGSG